MASNELCWVCNKALSVEATTKVNQNGLETIVKVSKEKRKDDHHQHLAKRQLPFEMHSKCREKYTMKRPNGELNYPDLTKTTPTRSFPYSPTKSKVRKSLEHFDFRNNCFICGKVASEKLEAKKDANRRDQIATVETKAFNTKVHDITEGSTYSLCKQISRRISGVDLRATEAKYHEKCRKQLLNLNARGEKSTPRGRPLDERVNHDMEKIFTYLASSEDSQFSLAELRDLTGKYFV